MFQKRFNETILGGPRNSQHFQWMIAKGVQLSVLLVVIMDILALIYLVLRNCRK